MKGRLLMIGISSVVVACIIVVNKKYVIKENVLYSQEILKKDYISAENVGRFMNRTQAIKKAQVVFKEGLGIDLKASDMEMYINLYHAEETYSPYRWVMSWYNEQTSETYSCSIDAEEGQILEVYAQPKNNQQGDLGETTLNIEEVGSLVEPFLKVIGRDERNYQIREEVEFNQNSWMAGHKRYTFINKTDERDRFIIEVNDKIKNIEVYMVQS